MKTLIAFVFVLMLLRSSGAQEAEDMYFMSQDVVRRACYYKPPGEGPFPVMIYNQATTKPTLEDGDVPFPALAKFYVSHGYVLFLPGRPVLNPSEDEKEAPAKPPIEVTGQKLLTSYAGHSANIESAVEWLKAQSFVDQNCIFMSGHSAGAIQTILLAQKDLGIQGFIAFSPAALLWDKHLKMQEALLRAVKNQKSPIFLIQPQNDFNLRPSIVLGPEVVLKGKPNRTKIFPAFGRSHAEGNAFAFNAPQIWGNDVLEFIKLCSQSSP